MSYIAISVLQYINFITQDLICGTNEHLDTEEICSSIIIVAIVEPLYGEFDLSFETLIVPRFILVSHFMEF